MRRCSCLLSVELVLDSATLSVQCVLWDVGSGWFLLPCIVFGGGCGMEDLVSQGVQEKGQQGPGVSF